MSAAETPEVSGELVFAAPWEAQAFAITLALHERGLFAWAEWAELLAQRIAALPQESYYAQWLAALEDMLERKGLASAEQLQALQQAWAHAAQRTPHGQPIELPAEGPEFRGTA